MLHFFQLILVLVFVACGSGEEVDDVNPFGDTKLTQPSEGKREIIKETIICREVRAADSSSLVFDTLVSSGEQSVLHYAIDFKSGDFKLSLYSPKRWNRREVSFSVHEAIDPGKLSRQYAETIIENEAISDSESAQVAVFIEPLTADSQHLKLRLRHSQENYSLTLNLLEREGLLFVDSAELNVDQLLGGHSERFENTLVEFENPHVDKATAKAKEKVKEVCETKQETKVEPIDQKKQLVARVGALKGNKLKARFYYKVDPIKGSIDAVTKIPNVPLYGKFEDKRHFVVKDKNTLILSNLRKLEIGKAFALDNEDDWTGRVKSRNEEQGYLILYIHNKSQKVKLELKVPYDDEVPKFVEGKFKINRGVIKLSLDFK